MKSCKQMKRLITSLFAVLALPATVNSSHLNNQRELIVTSKSSKESIAFAKYLKDNDIGRKDSYYGGYTSWGSGFGQSLARKEAYARAFAKHLEQNGITAIAMSRMD